MADQVSRLNWGCGPVQPPGWSHSDVVRWEMTQDHVGPISRGLPWPDETFEYVVTNHALQMVPWTDLRAALVELRRVTRTNGVLRLLVPDLLGAVDAYHRKDAEHFLISDDHERSIDGKLCMYLTQAGSTQSVFTEEWVIELCRDAGFAAACVVGIGETVYGPPGITDLDSRGPESIIVEAVR